MENWVNENFKVLTVAAVFSGGTITPILLFILNRLWPKKETHLVNPQPVQNINNHNTHFTMNIGETNND